MAKKKAKESDDFFAQLAEQSGGELLEGSGSSVYFIDTGNLALNYVCTGSRFMTGGIPCGITEIYGPSASAKSLVGYCLMGRNQKKGGFNVLLDCERASSENFAKAAGHLDPAKVIVHRPLTIEEVQQKIMATTALIRKKDKDVPILFVWDSIGVTMCAREARELNLPANYTQAQYKKIVGAKEQPGERAKAASSFLRKINPFLDENNAALFVINQIRSKIGVMYGNPETTAGGGNGLPFYANTRIRSQQQKRIDHKKRSAGKTKVAIGTNLKFVNKKCRSGPPFTEAEGVRLFFEEGIHPLTGLLSALICAGRVEVSGKGKFKVMEPWAGGKEVDFSATLTENEVPVEVLYSCPSIIDAESEEEIRDYLSDFESVISLSKSDDLDEKDDSGDDDFELDEETGEFKSDDE